METIQAGDGGTFEAYLALPPSKSGPGLVLFQEIFGVNRVMRDVADWYAERGFVVACPDLFWRQEPGIVLTDRSQAEWDRAFELYQGLDEDQAVLDCGATLAFLRGHPACTGKVGGIGFCLGGKLAYRFATECGGDAAVGYYGVGIEGALERANALSCPLMLHMPAEDSFCDKDAQAKIRAALEPLDGVTLHAYPGREHAFARPGGEHYDAADAELANLRSVEFLVRHLLAAAPPLEQLWEDHLKYEFETRDTEATLATMVPHAYVNHVPVLTGGVGTEQLRAFYSQHFIPKMPPDTEMTPVSRTVGKDLLVDEMVFQFTHTIEMDWMLPGVAPTGKRCEVPLVVVVHFEGEKLAHEHIYWDQASVLAQLGLIDPTDLPVAGVEAAKKVLDPALPANPLR